MHYHVNLKYLKIWGDKLFSQQNEMERAIRKENAKVALEHKEKALSYRTPQLGTVLYQCEVWKRKLDGMIKWKKKLWMKKRHVRNWWLKKLRDKCFLMYIWGKKMQRMYAKEKETVDIKRGKENAEQVYIKIKCK